MTRVSASFLSIEPIHYATGVVTMIPGGTRTDRDEHLAVPGADERTRVYVSRSTAARSSATGPATGPSLSVAAAHRATFKGTSMARPRCTRSHMARFAAAQSGSA